MATVQQARQAQEFWERARAYLQQVTGGGGRPSYGGGGASAHSQSATAGGIPRQLPGNNLRFGMTPTDADVSRFIATMGGNPYVPRYTNRTGARQQARSIPPGQQPTRPAQDVDVMQQFIASQQAAFDRANAMNEFRYGQGLGELGGLRDRNQQRWQTYGTTQEALNEEKAAEALDAQKARLQASGILNSNVLPAFQQRNARDLRLAQQAVAETRDARAAEFDTRDTGNLVGFIERREDVGPDPSQMAQWIMQYAQAQQQQQNNERDAAERQRQFNLMLNEGRRRSRGGAPFLPGPATGMRAPIMLTPGDIGMFNPAAGLYAGGPRIRYTPRQRLNAPTIPDAALASRVMQRQFNGYLPGDAQRANAAYVKKQADERKAQQNMQRFLEMNRRSNRGWM